MIGAATHTISPGSAGRGGRFRAAFGVSGLWVQRILRRITRHDAGQSSACHIFRSRGYWLGRVAAGARYRGGGQQVEGAPFATLVAQSEPSTVRAETACADAASDAWNIRTTICCSCRLMMNESPPVTVAELKPGDP